MGTGAILMHLWPYTKLGTPSCTSFCPLSDYSLSHGPYVLGPAALCREHPYGLLLVTPGLAISELALLRTVAPCAPLSVFKGGCSNIWCIKQYSMVSVNRIFKMAQVQYAWYVILPLYFMLTNVFLIYRRIFRPGHNRITPKKTNICSKLKTLGARFTE